MTWAWFFTLGSLKFTCIFMFEPSSQFLQTKFVEKGSMNIITLSFSLPTTPFLNILMSIIEVVVSWTWSWASGWRFCCSGAELPHMAQQPWKTDFFLILHPSLDLKLLWSLLLPIVTHQRSKEVKFTKFANWVLESPLFNLYSKE